MFPVWVAVCLSRTYHRKLGRHLRIPVESATDSAGIRSVNVPFSFDGTGALSLIFCHFPRPGGDEF